ncbi:MAG TPA: NADH-quinone oxidoreductase subunit G [Sedimenticola sp.]|nr:NADH-quinone oxidoreductase subunit G [Sedimenticola sp.]
MSEEKTITIEVDGQTLEAKPGALLIDVTDAAGIDIPRFCYHNKLSVAASCRMCLVEVEKVPKPIPACATQVTDGMKVQTRSPVALAAQKGTMEFLLINHPLDCPICDQGGECELQDVAMGYGSDVSRFVEGKRVVPQTDVGPLIATDMTRCIHCTRCVRFGDEIAGMRELGATGRGEHMTIGTYIAHSVDSELSGNVIDLCPVGALTSKPFRYRARAWELTRRDGVAPHDSVGSNIQIHVRRNRVMRVHPRENEAVNEVWISDRDRFSYEGLYSDDRLTRPLIKKNGAWAEASWEDALEAAARGLRSVAAADADQIGTLVSPTATLEELYLAQKITRGLGSANIDHRLRQSDFRSEGPAFPWLGQSIAELEKVDAALLIGSNVRKDQPLLAHRLRKASLKGAEVHFVNPLGLDLHFDANQVVSDLAGMVHNLAGIAKAAGGSKVLAGRVSVSDEHKAIAKKLKSAGSATILLGNLAQSHPDYSILYGLASSIAESTGAALGILPAAANTIGAALAGAVPKYGAGARPAEKTGLNARTMLESPRKGYLLLGLEPGLDCANPALAKQALAGAECVVALTAYRSPSLEETADVMLPIGAFAETSGTFVNAEGAWQGFGGAVAPLGEARPGWKVLRVLGNLMDLKGFDYLSSEEVRDELQQACAGARPENDLDNTTDGEIQASAGKLMRIGEVPIYAADALVRRAAALQETKDARDAAVARANATVAGKAGVGDGDTVAVVQGGQRAKLVLRVDARVPDGCVWVAAGVPGSESLGDQFGEISLEKV